MKLKAVINLFGGPGSGKSTTAAALFALMKKQGLSVELVSEYAKQMVFEDRMNVIEEDQLYIFAKQHRKIFTLRDTVDYVITDSPFVQGFNYLRDGSIYEKGHFKDLILSTFDKYPNINIFLNRGINIPYEQMGRYQNENEAKKVDDNIVDFLFKNKINFIVHTTGSNEELLLQRIQMNSFCFNAY